MERVRFKPIQSEREYREKLSEAETLANLDPDPDSIAGARLIELATVIEAWEREHYPVQTVARRD